MLTLLRLRQSYHEMLEVSTGVPKNLRALGKLEHELEKVKYTLFKLATDESQDRILQDRQ